MNQGNVLTLLATSGLNLPVVVSERNDPKLCSIGAEWNCLRKWAYRRAHRVVVQTESAKTYFSAAVQRRTVVIPNPVIVPPERPKKNHREGQKLIVGLGRLVPQKGFELLLAAFAQIASRHPDWSLAVWGEGGQRGQLEELRDRLGLRERVGLPGRTREPHEKLQQADLFVLSSRSEGFPNALGEAMACGLPVISFDCPSGPRDLIRDQVDGLLVPQGDVAALASAMERLMSNVDERNRLAARAVEVSERFGLEKVMALWETILQKEKRNA
jgi:glycosyltransferase involved in cell wall biosynthesis